jgi:hypothetical protein
MTCQCNRWLLALPAVFSLFSLFYFKTGELVWLMFLGFLFSLIFLVLPARSAPPQG